MARISSGLRFIANSSTPINQLPPEILYKVFFHFRPVISRGPEPPRSTREPFEDLLVVTHTCRHWRITAIDATDLWSQFTTRDPHKNKNFDNMTRLFIGRSGRAPLDVDLGYKISPVLAPHADRLRTFSCRKIAINSDEFSQLSSRPAPLLEEFHILPYEFIDSNCPPLPTLFNHDFPSLRKLVINGYNPFPNNRFRNLSSFHLQLRAGSVGRVFWAPFFTMLRESPQLEELYLRCASANDFPQFTKKMPTPVILHALRKLHLRNIPSSLTGQLLRSVDLIPNGIAMQFTNIVSGLDWLFPPPTLPLKLSFHAATSLEIIYSTRGFVIQGTNQGMRIRVEALDKDVRYAEIFSRCMSPQIPVRDLWIHFYRMEDGRGMTKLPPLSEFPHLKKLVVRVTNHGDPINQLVRMLEVDGYVPCPLLSTLDLSGGLSEYCLSKVLRDRSEAGCRLERLRLQKRYVSVESIERLGMRNFVDELEICDVDEEPCGMELPAVCTTNLGGWWKPWTERRLLYL